MKKLEFPTPFLLLYYLWLGLLSPARKARWLFSQFRRSGRSGAIRLWLASEIEATGINAFGLHCVPAGKLTLPLKPSGHQ